MLPDEKFPFRIDRRGVTSAHANVPCLGRHCIAYRLYAKISTCWQILHPAALTCGGKVERLLLPICLIFATTIMPTLSTAQNVTTFDGIYAGVSRDVIADNSKSSCTRGGNSYTLTITSGVARIPWGSGGELQGQVTPAGALTMRTASGSFIAHLDGQIDAAGKITANVAVLNCGYRMIWQKR